MLMNDGDAENITGDHGLLYSRTERSFDVASLWMVDFRIRLHPTPHPHPTAALTTFRLSSMVGAKIKLRG